MTVMCQSFALSLANKNLFIWRHFKTSSDLLLSSSSGFGYGGISNFSWRHNLHFFVLLEYGATDFRMYHFNVGVTLCVSFKSQRVLLGWYRSFLIHS